MEEQLGGGAPRGFVEIPDGLGVTIEPAVPKNHADGVRAALELIGDVVRHVERTPVVARVAWVQEVVADFCAVQLQLVIAKAADVGARLLGLAVQLERPAQQRGGMGVGVRGPGDPPGLPVGG